MNVLLFHNITFSCAKDQSLIKWSNHSRGRIKTNDELDKLIKHHNIINYIKAQRLSWFGHVQRMPASSTVKKIFKWTPLSTRSKGRPKQRWEDNIIQEN